MLLKIVKKFIFKFINLLEVYNDFFFLFFRLNYLLRLNINFLIILFIVVFISFIIFSKILRSNNILNYIFYNFVMN